MTINQFKKLTPEQFKEYGKSIPMGETHDKNGNEISYKDSHRYWGEWTYDKKRNPLSYKDSNGYWSEWTYDEAGNILSYKDSDGFWWEYTYDKNGNELTHNRGIEGERDD